jgi:hypothetical protein
MILIPLFPSAIVETLMGARVKERLRQSHGHDILIYGLGPRARIATEFTSGTSLPITFIVAYSDLIKKPLLNMNLKKFLLI